MTKAELKEIAEQLRCPSGSAGIEMAEVMHKTNIGMTLASIEALGIQDQQAILELGPGNCGHLSTIMQKAKDMTYVGLEVSETMQRAAEQGNQTWVAEQRVTFKCYDGQTIPYPDHTFDRIMTVNTLYFWQSPSELLLELYRVLRVRGRLVLTFATKQFMEKLPFVTHNFRLYDHQELNYLINQSPFRLSDILDKTEQVKSKAGDWVERSYSVAMLEK
ncbi:MAG: class I SAM-dependent methyltransferase [Bacteroidota bacterium]